MLVIDRLRRPDEPEFSEEALELVASASRRASQCAKSDLLHPLVGTSEDPTRELPFQRVLPNRCESEAELIITRALSLVMADAARHPISLTSVSSPGAYTDLLDVGRAASRMLRKNSASIFEGPRVEGLRASVIAAVVYDRVQESSFGAAYGGYKNVRKKLQAAQPALKPDETEQDRAFKLAYAAEQRKRFMQNCYVLGANALGMGLIGAISWIEAGNTENAKAPIIAKLEVEKAAITGNLSLESLKIIKTFSSAEPADLTGLDSEQKAQLMDEASALEATDQSLSKMKTEITAQRALSLVCANISLLSSFILISFIDKRNRSEPEAK